MKIGSTGTLSKQVGANIRRLRLRHKMTLQKLAEDIGVTYQQLQRYESGTAGIVLDRLAMIAEVFQVNAVELLTVPAQVTAD